MSMLGTLFSPLNYLRIRHPLKRRVDIVAPAVAFTIGGAMGVLWPAFNIFGPNGVILGTNGLLQILAGFFITSLAAVATFSGSTFSIDDPFEGQAAILDGEDLTRRQFLCQTFAYLALSAIFLYLIGVVSLAAATTLHEYFTSPIRLVLRFVVGGFYCAVLGHVLGTTLIGLVFLSSRMAWVSKRDKYEVAPSASRTTPNAKDVNTEQ